VPINTHLPNYFLFPPSGKLASFSFDGVGFGSPKPSNCHCIERVGTVFRMKGFGSDIGQMV
jgi:hypothetical protein